ncbi:MAG: hypothetical protein PVS3B3_28660 [Ktedonobacteraceae bacterium]
MRSTTVPLPTSDLDDLQQPPHVLSQLIDMLFDERQSLLEQQEQRWAHLATCIPCQAFLGSYLLKTIEYDSVHGNPEGPAQGLLARLIQSMHQTLKADLPPYVETLEELGIEDANTRFPQFVEHLQTCRECQVVVQDMQERLQQRE